MCDKLTKSAGEIAAKSAPEKRAPSARWSRPDSGLKELAAADSEIFAAISAEMQRQEEHIELIASENYASPAVLAAQGSVLTNKYAEGYPGRRYYGGCQAVDVAETIAIERAKDLYKASYSNVQPHSGAQANAAVYGSLLKPGDRILGMRLDQGGHLTHGSPVNFSGRTYKAAHYGLDAAEHLDYLDLEKKAKSWQPKIIIAGYSAYSGLVDWARIRAAADAVGALFLVDMSHISGLVAAGVYPSPLPHAHIITSTTHKTLRGPRSGMILSADPSFELHKKLNFGVFPLTQGGPLMHAVAAKAICFAEAMQSDFVDYQNQVLKNAVAMAAVFVQRGYRLVGGATCNHMLLIDLTGKGVTGKEAEAVLEDCSITTNKNAVPNDPNPPAVTSGIRIGTAAITTRGCLEPESRQIATWICDLLDLGPDPKSGERAKVRLNAAGLCRRFPVYASGVSSP